MKEQIRNQIAFAYHLTYEDMDEKTILRVKEVILDSLGCITLGMKQQPAASLEDKIFDYARAMVSTELYEGNRFAIGHPASHIMPVMLAVCGEEHVFSKKFITVFAAAYEIASRWGASITFPNRILGHGTVMTTAAAVAYGLLTEVSEETLYQAVFIAGSLPCVSVWQSVYEGSELHDCYTGLAGITGVRAIKMAEEGIACTEEMVKEVFKNIMSASLKPENLDKSLGEEFWINRNYFKVHTGCRFIHPFADTIAAMMKEGLREEDIDHIEIYTYKKAAQINAQEAVNEVAAKFSTPVSIAVLLHTGELTCENVHSYATDEHIKALAGRIYLREKEDYNRLLPDVRGGKVIVCKKDQTVIEREVFHAEGDYDNPRSYTKEDVIAKFRQNVSGKMRKQRQEELIQGILAG